MTDPTISVVQLNQILVLEPLAGKTNAQQDALLRTNPRFRNYYINLFYQLMYRANQKNPFRTLSRLFVLKTNGKQIGLSARQQVGLYFYFISQQQSGASRLVQKSQIIEQQIRLLRLRSVNNPT